MKKCLRLDASERPTCSNLLKHEFFEKDGFAQKFQAELTVRIMKENQNNPLLKSPNISALRNKESPDHENNSKKKKKEYKEKKDTEDKPKRKLPDPGKFSKKNTPSTSTITTTTQATLHLSQSSPSQQQQQQSPLHHHHHHHHHHQQQQQQPHHPHQQGDGAEDIGPGSPSQGSMPPIQASTGQPSVTRMNEKVKKQPMNFYKKPGPAPNHHSSTLSPKPNLQTEKTSLHDKSFLYDKLSGSGGRGSKEVVKDKDRGMLFPELKGAEAHPVKNKSKKGYVSSMPHITTLNPFDMQNQDDSSSNFPNV